MLSEARCKITIIVVVVLAVVVIVRHAFSISICNKRKAYIITIMYVRDTKDSIRKHLGMMHLSQQSA